MRGAHDIEEASNCIYRYTDRQIMDDWMEA